MRIKALCVENALNGRNYKLVFLLPWVQNWIKQLEAADDIHTLSQLITLGWAPLPINLPMLQIHPEFALIICRQMPDLRKSIIRSIAVADPKNLQLMETLGIKASAKQKFEQRYCREESF